MDPKGYYIFQFTIRFELMSNDKLIVNRKKANYTSREYHIST